MSRESNRPEEDRVQSNDLRFAPCQKNTESRTAATPRTLHAWQMTLEEFRQHYFPELCGDQPAFETDLAPHRDAA